MSKAKPAVAETPDKTDKARARKTDARPKAKPAKTKAAAASDASARPAAAAKRAPAKAAKPDSKGAKAPAKPAAKAEPKPAKSKAPARAAKPRPATPAAKPAPVEPEPATELAHFAITEDAAPIEPAVDPLEDDDEDALAARVHGTADALAAAAEPEPEPVRELSPEEQELSALYGDELTPGALATTEYRDHRTADEDRPMSPEINAREERQKRWDDRRRKRRERRPDGRPDGGRPDARPQGGRPDGGRPDARPQGGRPDARPHEPRPVHPGNNGVNDGRALPAPALVPVPLAVPASLSGAHAVHRVGNSLGDAAWVVFASLRSNQPLPVKQLAAMMRKRGLIEIDPEQIWPHLKAALIGDERSYRQLGLRPRIVYRGRDLFGPGPVATSSTSGVESALAAALSQLAVATHAALKDRIGRANATGFERIVHAYLVSTGYEDIEWVKRVSGISYATALPPDGGSPILVSARSGNEPVDRRGVGELRVGVEAKQLLAGLLLSARELSEEAERELVRPGRSIMVLCGDAFVGALIGAGVGVVTAAAPLRYVDDALLDELLAG